MSRYRVERVVPYSVEQMFELAADVEQYPHFLPWWTAARVCARSADSYRTDQVLRFGVIRQRFTSTTTLDRPRRIEVVSSDPPFRVLRLTWCFEPAGETGCRIMLQTETEFRARIVQRAFDLVLSNSPEVIVNAFERRARALYGQG